MTATKYLYKYRCWDDLYHQRILTHNEIYFASSKDFNDPFDCLIPITFPKMSLDDMYKYFDSDINGLNPDQIQQLLKRNSELGFFEDDDKWSDMYRLQMSYIEDRMGIFSLSDLSDNILMWSHYSNSHKGICFGLDADALLDYFGAISKNTNFTIVLHPVIYANDFPHLTPTSKSELDIYVRKIITKAYNWKYENEFRCIIGNKQNSLLDNKDRIVLLPDVILGKVILGCKIDDNHKEEIISLLAKRPHKIELLQAKMKKDQFGLDFEPIPY